MTGAASSVGALSPADTIDFYYDVISPYAYLASEQVGALAAELGLALRWRPIFLAGLQKALGAKTILEAPAKARYVLADSHDQAARLGLPLRYPRPFPAQTLAAQRAVAAAPEAARGPLAQALFRAAWARGEDVGAAAVLAAAIADTARALALDPDELAARAASAEAKEALRAATDEAQRRGVFGVPTLVVGDKMFWGQDRLDTLRWWVARHRQGA